MSQEKRKGFFFRLTSLGCLGLLLNLGLPLHVQANTTVSIFHSSGDSECDPSSPPAGVLPRGPHAICMEMERVDGQEIPVRTFRYSKTGDLKTILEADGTLALQNDYYANRKLKQITRSQDIHNLETHLFYTTSGERIATQSASGEVDVFLEPYLRFTNEAVRYRYEEAETADDGETLEYLVKDHLGSVVSKVTPNHVLSQKDFYPFGKTWVQNSLRSQDPRGFNGTTADDVFLDYNARHYDRNGRFIQTDAVVPDAGKSISANRYAYTNNNPLIYTDPSGNFPLVFIMVAASITSYATILASSGISFRQLGWERAILGMGMSAISGAISAGTMSGTQGLMKTGIAKIGQGSLLSIGQGMATIFTSAAAKGVSDAVSQGFFYGGLGVTAPDAHKTIMTGGLKSLASGLIDYAIPGGGNTPFGPKGGMEHAAVRSLKGAANLAAANLIDRAYSRNAPDRLRDYAAQVIPEFTYGLVLGNSSPFQDRRPGEPFRMNSSFANRSTLANYMRVLTQHLTSGINANTIVNGTLDLISVPDAQSIQQNQIASMTSHNSTLQRIYGPAWTY